MKANQIKVLYVSCWEEGNIESDAILDLNTGMVTDIENGEGGENFEYHINDIIQIASDGVGILAAVVEADANGDYRVTNITELETFRAAARFEVLSLELGGFINASTQDGAPAYFQALEAARLDLEDHLIEVRKAVFDGNMLDEYDPSEFLIREIATGETLEAVWDQTEADKLVFVNSSVVYGLDDDQPTTCPKCGSRTDFDEMGSGLQRHACLGCGKVFFAVDDDGMRDAGDDGNKDAVHAMAKTISSKLDKLGFRNRGKPIKHTQLLEVAAAALGFRNKHVALADTGKPACVNKDFLALLETAQRLRSLLPLTNGDDGETICRDTEGMGYDVTGDIEEIDVEITRAEKLASSYQGEKTEPMPSNRAKLIIEVDYDLNAESIDDMAANLRGMADFAIQEGLLTGATTAEVDRYKVELITSNSVSPTPTPGKMEYAVIGYYDDNGQIFCHHVEARDAFNAFAIVAAKADEDGTLPQFIAALPESDTRRMEYPGEGVVCFETVLKQNDVFPQ